MTTKILFLCLGNICRSPMAEAIFSHLVEEAGLSQQIVVDSAGTGTWHIGEPACAGTRKILAKNGYQYRGQARQITEAEMNDPQCMVVAMSAENIRDLQLRFGDRHQIVRLLDFAENSSVQDVPDPYYEGNFEYVYQLVEDGCRGLLKSLQRD